MFQKLTQIRNSVTNWIVEKSSNNVSAEAEAMDSSGTNEKTHQAVFASLTDKLKRLQDATGNRANQLAESLAKQITAWTGKKTTAADVKKGAQTGAIIGTIVAMFLVANQATTQNSHPCSDSGSGLQHNTPRQRHFPGNGSAETSWFGVNSQDELESHRQAEEEWLEHCRIHDDHLDHVRMSEQQEYLDQMQTYVDDHNSYFDN